MIKKILQSILITTIFVIGSQVTVISQSISRDFDNNDDHDNYDRVRIDRYLDTEVWVNHSDGEYYEGDDISIYFRSNSDAFVAIYSIDSRGRVNLLFPSGTGEDNYIRGGVTYSLPGRDDDYDLNVTGPEGFENIQIIASRERFNIPNWYHNSGLVANTDDRQEYMDYLNARYFVKYSGQRFSYDRAAIYVNEWEENYYSPVYYPDYPSWTTYGNMYIDYGWGSSVYINGYYWGISPLYIPRVAVGWQVISIYDSYGYCWESDFHVSRYNTIVFDKTIINPRSETRSKYKAVRQAGYRNPVKNGYPAYKKGVITNKSITTGGKSVRGNNRFSGSVKSKRAVSTEKKYLRGSSKVIRTDRGFETDVSSAIYKRTKTNVRSGRTRREQAATGRIKQNSSSRSESNYRKNRNTSKRSAEVQTKRSSGSEESYYRKKTGKNGNSTHSGDFKKRTTRRTINSSKTKHHKVNSNRKEKKKGSYKPSGNSHRKHSSKDVKRTSQQKGSKAKVSSKKSSGSRVNSSSKNSHGKASTSSKSKGSGSKSGKRPR